MVHVESWQDWNDNYYSEAQKSVSSDGCTLYVHNRKSGEIIKFSKKIKFSVFFEKTKKIYT